MKKLLAVLLLMSLMLQLASPINGVTDKDILSDPIINTYTATNLGPALIRNLTFSDVGAGFWAQDPITRLGALDIVKGYNEGNNRRYRPEQAVTQEEALAFLLRVIGQEGAAQQAALALEDQPVGQATLTLWSKGYIAVANQLGIITEEELADFVGNTPATRERVAKWIVDIVNAQVPETLPPLYTQQMIFNYSDWQNMGSSYIPYIEAVGQAQIMVGDGTAFRPKSSLTRAEMAQIIKNMGDILYKTKGLTLKSGIVGFVRDDVETTGLQNTGSRTLLVRNDNGEMDAFVVKAATGSAVGTLVEDAVVLSAGAVRGLRSLREGDIIDYLVEDATAELKYVQVKGSDRKVTVTGILEPLARFDEGILTIKNTAGVTFSYKLADGLYSNERGTLRINDTHYPFESAPVTNQVALTLQNNLITVITYEGDLVASNEITGIITEINTQFAYITLVTWDGKKVTKYYQKNSVIVEKQPFYESADTIGYVDELFPDFRFDSQDTSIDALDIGDIVYLQLNPSNTTYATRIRAKTNYIIRYGLIQELVDYGAEGIRARVEYSDNSVGLVTIDGRVPVMKEKVNVKTTGLLVGQVVRMLVNQGVVEPGIVIEKVMAVEVDPYGNKVKEVYRGELGSMNTSQSTLSLRNSYVLAKLGWSNYSQSRTLNVDKNTAYFYNDKQISLAYADTYLRTATMQAYIVTGETFGKERILRVVFRDGRSTVLAHSNIIKTDGQSEVSLLSQPTPYVMDAASIVIKNGYLVSVQNIFSPDYAQIALAGSREAAVINIVAEPSTSALSVFRGRLQSVERDLAFNVHSHAILKDMTWIYSPIEREFELNFRTVFMNEEGIVPMNQFMDYSELSKVDEVYTVIAEGTTAKYIVANPYAQEGVIGEIYSITPEQLMIKDVLVYNTNLKTWSDLSLTNSYGQVDLLTHSIILKNNEVISTNQLEIGDKIRVMTTENMSEKLKLSNGRDVVGYIIFVEK